MYSEKYLEDVLNNIETMPLEKLTKLLKANGINFVKKKKPSTKIIKRSNIIQFDDMGYPLRLVINNNGKQIWVDTVCEEGDTVLIWEDLRELP